MSISQPITIFRVRRLLRLRRIRRAQIRRLIRRLTGRVARSLREFMIGHAIGA